MLKLFSTRKWLVTLLLLVAAMVMPVTGKAQMTLTYDSSSSGYSNETASNLFDGDTSTKWCYDAPSTSSSAWVVFKANEACRLKGYTITTANDNASNRNRNPKDWKIYGSNDKSNWTVLVSVSNDSKLQDENSTSYKYTLATGIATKYEYYKWEITANQGAGVFQVSEFSITVSQCTETEHEVALLLKEQRDATCTEVGYTQDVYQCSSCGRCYSDAEGTLAIDLASVIIPAKGHTFNGENGDCSVCGVSHMLSHAGTSADPFQISNADDLYWFAAWVNGTYTPAEGETAVTHLDACAVLTNDITVNTGVLNADGTLVSDVSGFREWTPIGRRDFSYDGIFNGQGHTISGLYFNDSQRSYVGFFGYTEIHSKISNVGIVDSYFCGSTYVGGMCGRGYGIIENCYNANTVSGTSIVGGVCGFKDYRPINNCYITGAVSGSDHVGGVCGYNYATISNCYFNSEKCDKDAVGTNHSSTVINTKGKTTAQFASGEVCYLLNKGVTNDTQSWYQNLASEGGDTYPVLKSNGNNTVYVSQPCTLQFSNTPAAIEHSLDPDGFCTKCGGYEPATLTTDKHDINGDGEKDAVYEIANAGQLYWFAALVNGTLADGTAQNPSAKAVLLNDITVNTGVLTADGTLASDVSGFRVWTPVGNDSNPYQGTFDGQSHTVSGLYFNNSATDYVGLFGYIGNGGKISNVGVVDSYFYGKNDVGGVCGRSISASISNCYSAGSVSGSSSFVGGVCGYSDNGNISNCYSASAVIGNTYVGGVCGYNYRGTVLYCYFNSEKCNKDAVGTNDSGTVTNVEGKTTAQFASGEVCYLLNEGKTDGTQAWYQNLTPETGDQSPIWKATGENTVYQVTKYSGCEHEPGTSVELYSNLNKDIYEGYTSEGTCPHGYQKAFFNSTVNAYEISNVGQLLWFAGLVNGTLTDGTAQNLSANAVLVNDITVNTGVLTADGTLASDVSGFRVWTPVGNDSNPYQGTFDGQSHTVSGLYFNNSATDYVGLFGYIGNGGKISNVGVVDSYFYGKNDVGGVCGRSISASISNCYSAGSVSGSSSFVGGVCGYSDNGNISNCYSASAVIGNTYVGGVCGNNHSGETSNCYSVGSVRGGTDVGGVCGKTNNGTISNCYSVGAVSGPTSVGGVCGNNYFSTISNCYFDSEECDKDAIGTRNGGIATNVEGKTTAQFASGEVCYLLNGSKSDGTQAWYQNLAPQTGDKHPVLTNSGNNTVYDAPLLCGGIKNVGNTYANTETVSVEHVLGEEVSFNEEKSIYQKICQRTGCGTAFYFADSKGLYAAEEDEGTFTTDTYVLQDATEYVNQAVCTATEFTYTRSFPGTNWAAWYVPFELTLTEEICSKYKFSRISNVHQYDTDYNGTADKTIVESFIQKPGVTLQANYPYLVKPVTEADREMSLTLTNVVAAKAESNSIDCQSVDYKYTFTGTYSGLGDGGTADSSPYALFSDGQWWHFKSLSPMRHYLTISSLTPSYLAAPALIVLQVTGEEGATGIVNPYDENRKKSETYDLSGRRLPEHNQHGLMIRDGKVIWKK